MKERYFGLCHFCHNPLNRHNSSSYSRRKKLCLGCRRKISQLEVEGLCFSCFKTLTPDNSGEESRCASLCFKCFTGEILTYLRGAITLYDQYFEEFYGGFDIKQEEDDEDEPFFE